MGWLGFSGADEIGFPSLVSWTFATSLLYIAAHLLGPASESAQSVPAEPPPHVFFAVSFFGMRSIR